MSFFDECDSDYETHYSSSDDEEDECSSKIHNEPLGGWILKAIDEDRIECTATIGCVRIYKITDTMTDSPFEFAIKKIAPSCNDGTLMSAYKMREGDVIDTLDHPNIITMYASFSQHLGEMSLVLPYMKGGDLHQYTVESSHLTPNDMGIIVGTLINAIWYLHHVANMVHRDIKPENILIDVPGDFTTLKLSDFGYASEVRPDVDAFLHPSFREEGNPGTPKYSAPDLFRHQQTRNPRAADCWAFGVTLFVLAEKRFPFWGATTSELKFNLGTIEITERSFKRFRDPDFMPIVTNLLYKDPKRRLTIDKLKKLSR